MKAYVISAKSIFTSVNYFVNRQKLAKSEISPVFLHEVMFIFIKCFNFFFTFLESECYMGEKHNKYFQESVKHRDELGSDIKSKLSNESHFVNHQKRGD
jgi:hypothetical protein